LFLFILFSLATLHAQNGPDMAFERLSNVEVFAFGGVGYAGTTSQGERDFLLLMSTRNALAVMQKLLREGNPQAAGYALAGIRELDRKKFQELAKPLQTSTYIVKTMSGCIVQPEKIAAVIQRISAGRYSPRSSRAGSPGG
jgi:hypothetical protein